ncbi:MAG TPA: hypothetical protein VL084_13465 [Thermoanaerobaculia bacterium]|nr:hypothetical protein [Thermoanaerobaculia bacterium]
MRWLAPLLLAALLPGQALAAEQPAATTTPVPKVSLVKVFRLFSDLTSIPFLRLPGGAKDPDPLHLRQTGDPDSVISPGAATLSNEVSLKPAFEINDILLKAYTPDALVSPGDNRFRSAGTFSPLDEHHRPYQFRLGARLVW